MSHDPQKIELTADLRYEIAVIAARTGKSSDRVISEALAAYRQANCPELSPQPKSWFDAATELGLIGSVSSGPPT
jgi:hypothetical protein